MAYLILGLFVVPAAVFFFVSNQTEVRRFQFQARVASGWHQARLRTRTRMQDPALADLLRRSGLTLSASTYNTLRVVMALLFLILGAVGLVSGHAVGLVFPVLVWYGLESKKPFPMHYAFGWLQKQAASRRDRDLYLLYRLMLQEIVAFRAHPLSVHEMLRRQRSRLTVIRPFVERCLDHWTEDPGWALQTLGQDIGTKQAATFTQMLQHIEEAGLDVAADVFEENHEGFRSDRIAAFKVQLGARALLGTALTMMGMGAVTYDLQVVIQNYTALMLHSVGY